MSSSAASSTSHHSSLSSCLNAVPSRELSSATGPHSTRDVSPFLIRSKARDGTSPSADGSAATTTTTSATSSTSGVKTPIPDHIHSATCGCSSDSTIAGDDQLIIDESGSEAFLTDIDQSISALNAVDESLGHTEAVAAAAGDHSPSSTIVQNKWNLHSLLDHNHRFV